jgi:hypothetical protein
MQQLNKTQYILQDGFRINIDSIKFETIILDDSSYNGEFVNYSILDNNNIVLENLIEVKDTFFEKMRNKSLFGKFGMDCKSYIEFMKIFNKNVLSFEMVRHNNITSGMRIKVPSNNFFACYSILVTDLGFKTFMINDYQGTNGEFVTFRIYNDKYQMDESEHLMCKDEFCEKISKGKIFDSFGNNAEAYCMANNFVLA